MSREDPFVYQTKVMLEIYMWNESSIRVRDPSYFEELKKRTEHLSGL
jgi:hypothetical protein